MKLLKNLVRLTLLLSLLGLVKTEAQAETISTSAVTLSNVTKAPAAKGRFITRKAKKYFRLSGTKKMHTGWLLYNKKKYYFNRKGQMQTGWQKISGSWYYFKSAGSLHTTMKVKQFVLVRASRNRAKVYLLKQSRGGKWKQQVSANGYVGRNGITAKKREGDRKTPKGIYTLGRIFGVSRNPGTTLPYTKLNSSHYWVDDPASPYYNQFVSTRTVRKNWNSAEHLISYTTAYAYAVAVDYNTAGTPGKGSAIFLHCSTGGPTAGCIAVPRKSMIRILRRLEAGAKIHIQ